MTRKKEHPYAPEGAKYPLLYKPRKWSDIRVCASGDARWAGIAAQEVTINRTTVLDIQRRNREREVTAGNA